MSWKNRVVGALNSACTAIDDVAYRPAVVRLTLPLPRWWNCQLAHLSMRLDARWGTGYWASADAPAAPGVRCQACKRRASWLFVGGPLEADLLDGDEADDPTSWRDPYLATHKVQLCGWCHLDADTPIRTAADLERELTRAGKSSVGWHWRWQPSR